MSFIIGWKEWCSIPNIGIPAIKAKVDTGAKTSCIHAYDIERFDDKGVKSVRFKVHPLQKNERLEIECSAPLYDYRNVTSSNGEREKRYVIKEPLILGSQTYDIEITLSSRHEMQFRMLLGRDALTQFQVVVDTTKSFTRGKISNAPSLYE